MIILRYVARPGSGNRIAAKYDGAYINCWVSTASLARARVVARKVIRTSGWAIQKLEEVTRVERLDYRGRSRSLALYDEAVRDGYSLMIHTWPSRRRTKTAERKPAGRPTRRSRKIGRQRRS